MKRLFAVILITLFAIASASMLGAAPAFAATACELKAVGSDGKPLGGAAKSSFLKKCKEDACTAKAVGSDGKPLAGAAKASFMKKCEGEA